MEALPTILYNIRALPQLFFPTQYTIIINSSRNLFLTQSKTVHYKKSCDKYQICNKHVD